MAKSQAGRKRRAYHGARPDDGNLGRARKGLMGAVVVLKDAKRVRKA